MTTLCCADNYGPCKKARNRPMRFGIVHDFITWVMVGSCAQIGTIRSRISVCELPRGLAD